MLCPSVPLWCTPPPTQRPLEEGTTAPQVGWKQTPPLLSGFNLEEIWSPPSFLLHFRIKYSFVVADYFKQNRMKVVVVMWRHVKNWKVMDFWRIRQSKNKHQKKILTAAGWRGGPESSLLTWIISVLYWEKNRNCWETVQTRKVYRLSCGSE